MTIPEDLKFLVQRRAAGKELGCGSPAVGEVMVLFRSGICSVS